MGNRNSSRNATSTRDASMRAAVEASLSDAPLPMGWEEAVSPKGVTYYIDHASKSTTFTDPRQPLTGRSRRNRRNKRRGRPPKYVLTFYAKVQHTRAVCHQIMQDDGTLQISVNRASLFQDSFDFIRNLDALTLTRTLRIKFEGEKGLDYGGMSREWFLKISEAIIDPKFGLFKKVGRYEYQIDPNSYKVDGSLELFNFIGTIMGMALYHGHLFQGYFSHSFYKAFLGKKLTMDDLALVDEALHKSMSYILACDDIEDLDLTFALSEKYNGEDVEFELKKGGAKIEVTKKNKDEFVRLAVNHYVFGAEQQMAMIREGFIRFVPDHLLESFSPEDLIEVFGGRADIDLADLKAHTIYDGGYDTDSSAIKWFWEVLDGMSQDELRKLLQFTTGTTKVPVGGFEHLYGSNGPQKFTILLKEQHGLPSAHSCFNRLELPEYASLEEVKDNLLLAISEGSEGFSLE